MKKQQLEAKVSAVFVMEREHAPIATPRQEVRVTWEGFEGDKHAGLTRKVGSRGGPYPRGMEIRNTRQVSLVSEEELAKVAETMGLPRVEPAWVGANLMLAGIPDLTLLPPGTRFIFPDEAALVVEEENLPCTSAGKAVQSQYPERNGLATVFPKAAIHKRGLVGWVERPGVIRTGDKVQVLIPEPSAYPVR